jgi:Bacteriophage translational regulator
MNEVEAILDKMVPIELVSDDDFLIIKETLTRIGVASASGDTLFQSCHILHKRGKYYISHFKLLFELDGKPSNFSKDDAARMNTISKLLEDWALLKILKPISNQDLVNISKIKIISSDEKKNWNLIPKHRIGSQHNNK